MVIPVSVGWHIWYLWVMVTLFLFKGTYCECLWYTQGLWRPVYENSVRKITEKVLCEKIKRFPETFFSPFFFCVSYNLPAILYIHALLHMHLQVIGSRKALATFLQRSKTENTLFFIHGFMKTELFALYQRWMNRCEKLSWVSVLVRSTNIVTDSLSMNSWLFLPFHRCFGS